MKKIVVLMALLSVILLSSCADPCKQLHELNVNLEECLATEPIDKCKKTYFENVREYAGLCNSQLEKLDTAVVEQKCKEMKLYIGFPDNVIYRCRR